MIDRQCWINLYILAWTGITIALIEQINRNKDLKKDRDYQINRWIKIDRQSKYILTSQDRYLHKNTDGLIVRNIDRYVERNNIQSYIDLEIDR